MKLYMAVTPDKYELPLAVETNASDLAKMFGTNQQAIFTAISKNLSGKQNGVKFVKVEVYM